MSGLWDGFLDLLFPPKCPFCRAILRRPGICDDCAADLPWIDDRDAFRVIRGLYCAAPLRYVGAARRAILRFKFRGHTAAARAFGPTLAACAAQRYPGMFDAAQRYPGTFDAAQRHPGTFDAAQRHPGMFDVVTWAPISRERRRRRGYDQSELLARAACRAWGTRPEALLVKTRDNPPQSRIRDAAARWANVTGVYRPAPGADLRGKRVLLIDDICTSGATLCECAKCLRDGGAAEIYALTLAMAGQRREK